MIEFITNQKQEALRYVSGAVANRNALTIVVNKKETTIEDAVEQIKNCEHVVVEFNPSDMKIFIQVFKKMTV